MLEKGASRTYEDAFEASNGTIQLAGSNALMMMVVSKELVSNQISSKVQVFEVHQFHFMSSNCYF